MTTSSHPIKIHRAQHRARVGGHRASADVLWRAIPDMVIARLTSLELAELLDALWRLSHMSKRIAQAEAIQDGAVWDEDNQVFRELT